MNLPPTHVALAASAKAELLAAAALADRPLPPVGAGPAATGRPLRIVYLMPRTGPGGGSRVLLEHANHLVGLGARVTVVSHDAPPAWFALRAAFVEVPFGRPLEQSIPACDVIVAGYWSQVLPARHLGVAPVVHFEQGDFHLYEEVGEEMRRLVAASVRAADWTVTVGEAPQRALAERYGVVADRIANAVDAAVFHPAGPRPATRTVMFVGWDGAAFKGIDVARRVAVGLGVSHPDVRIVWVTPAAPVGDGMGEVVVSPPQAELARRYREASVYVGTSRYESFPLPPLEAMASGVPVVSTANEGILAYGEDGVNCVLAAVDDAEGLLDATRRVLDDEELSDRLRAGGLATAAAHSWPEILGGLLARYGEIGRPRPAPEGMPVLAVGGLAFADKGDAEMLVELVGRSPYREVAIPVSRPGLAGYRDARWEVVARRPDGVPGVARFYRPASAAEPVEDAEFQFGIDLLREGLADEAFAWFADQSRQAPADRQVVIGRWILLALLLAGRAEDAGALAETFAAEYPACPDYYVLGVRAAGDVMRRVDLPGVQRTVRALGPGVAFSEWLEDPVGLLAGVPESVAG